MDGHSQTPANEIAYPAPMMATAPHTEQVQEQQIMSVTARMQPPSKAVAAPKYKKAPDAPKRFKSAFIIFSAEKHKEIKEDLAKQGRSEKTTDIAKLVSEAWRELNPDQKEIWEKKARKDKARYEVEKAMYKGPWKVPANKRTPKDPTAPKRPMSAFLAFSNKRRAALKRQHPDATNADLSKMLSKTWKEAPEELRRKYMDEEAELRQTYKVEMAKWRKKVAEEKKAERKEREAMAMQTAENRANEAARNAGGPPVDGMGPEMGGMGGSYYGFQPQQGQGDMNYAMQGGQQGQPQQGGQGNQQGQYMGAPFAPGMQQQQLLQQLLANQQMNPMMGNGRGGGGMGMYGQPNGGQFGGQQGSGNQYGGGVGSAGGNFGMDSMSPPAQQGGEESQNESAAGGESGEAANEAGAAPTGAEMPAFDQQQNFAPPGFARPPEAEGEGGEPEDAHGGDGFEGTAI